MRKIPVMIPYFTEDESEEVKKTLSTGWVAQGPKVQEFENIVASHENVKYGIATTSCTTALHLLMVAMGLNENYEVLVPSFTFIASANAVEYTGATPILVDVDTTTYNIDIKWTENFIESNYSNVDGKLINKKSGKTLFGIVVVNEFGLCADIPAINELAQRYDIKIIEDSACALGASINGVHEGAFGNPSCVSFHPRKSITTGEGGMVLTDDESIAETVRRLRSHGASLSEVARHQQKGFLLPEFNELGYNYRMTDIQAAVGVAQMRKFEFIQAERQKRAAYYDKLIDEKFDFLKTPFVPKGYNHTYQSYVCMVDYKALGFDTIEQGNDFRNKLMNDLDDLGIATRQGTHAVHTLGFYADKYGYKPYDLPGAYECDRLSLTLPLYIQMTEDDQNYVVECMEKVLKTIR
jgi:perosamine synthetase